ncbi:hypothetical protein MML48_4g00017144 [Holotrichia oblita]|uniref:Uncharacterized protein n=1 Tax=Holotrichia oblita TaxID=644536 RepID=A0ACB9T7U3_HOLOL|nr:hypothetical protein MML48_4g00017144 [Holotrichia oblita]
MEDKRFTHVATDPKFRRIPKAERKVKIDKRFKSMFKDKKFKVKYSVDSRGRPVNYTSTENLKRYYHLSSEESSSSEEEDIQDEEHTEPGKFVKAPKDSGEESNTESNDLTVGKNDVKVSGDIKKKLKNLQVDYARGESRLFSESSSDEESESEAVDTEEIEHNWGELDADAERTDDITCRLAACNMDWDRIRAVDLMVLFNSFLPQGGVIKSVVIYPSEFGKQRLQEEEVKGPIELVEDKLEQDDDEENEEGAKYHMEKLRKYQLNRLKYYYAVVTCDTPNTANKIYSECDGMEYESSATKIDLRFIPDDMTFDDEPKEICNKLPEITKYQPKFFTTTALQQAKTNPERTELTQKLASGKLEDIDENDLQAYLASSSGEEDDENGELKPSESESDTDQANPIDKYRALLSEIESKENEKKEKDVEMEISWGIDLQKKTDKLIKQKQLESEDKTPFQLYLDKRKEKLKAKREEKKQKSQDANGNSDNEDGSDIPSDIDMNDPYFAEEFNNSEFKQKKTSLSKSKLVGIKDESDKQREAELELLLMHEDNKNHFDMKKFKKMKINLNQKRNVKRIWRKSHHYNIDPADSRYKKTKGMEKLINEKLKRRNEEVQQEESNKKPKRNAELNVLIKSVKQKAQDYVNKKS